MSSIKALLVGLLCLAAAFCQAVSVIQSGEGTIQTLSSGSLVFGSAPSNGDEIVMFVLIGGASRPTISSITETGVTWSEIGSPLTSGNEVSYAYLGVVGSGASATISMGLSGSGNVCLSAVEASGIGASDVGASSTTSGVSGTTSTSTVASELWICVFTNGASASAATYASPTNSFTLASSTYCSVTATTVHYGQEIAYKVVASTGAASCSVTVTGSILYSQNQIGTLKGVAAGVTIVPRLPLLGVG